MRAGLISDTHGMLRPAVFDHFRDLDRILHAGDVGDPGILIELEAVAPVTAVYGNTDTGELRDRLNDVEELDLDGIHTVLVHGDSFGSPTPTGLASEYPQADLIVYGHTHSPLVEQVGGVTVANPGSAGPKRFTLPVSIAVAEFGGSDIRVRHIAL